MYLRIKNGNIEYPYNIQNLRKDEYNVSFPENVSDIELEGFGVYKVFLTPKPNDYTKNITEGIPEFIEGNYYQKWEISNASDVDINNRIQFKWAEVREYRNQLLKECDWTVLPDSPVGDKLNEWVDYRADLRNVTEQENPFNIIWPAQP
jgi:hypothetical protein